MDLLRRRLMSWFQVIRTSYLEGFARFCLRHNITANGMTMFSFIFGLLAVYYLFDNHFLFILFAVLHILGDALDGVIARLSSPSRFGQIFDHVINDRGIEFLFLLKIAFLRQDYFIYIIIGLYICANVIHFMSDEVAPILYSRTLVVLLLFFQLITLTILIEGIFVLYSLAAQLHWYLIRTKNNS